MDEELEAELYEQDLLGFRCRICLVQLEEDDRYCMRCEDRVEEARLQAMGWM